jgi:hypothetical protein
MFHLNIYRMKKSVLLLSFLFIAACSGLTQSLSLALWDIVAGELPNGATITKTGITSAEIIQCLAIINKTNDPVHVKVKKTFINILPGTENTFCWKICLDKSVFISPWYITILANATDYDDFSGHYRPNGVSGVSTIKYTFFVSDKIGDSVHVNVNYAAYPLGEQELADGSMLTKAYPNPADNQAAFAYNIPPGGSANLVVRNILGTVVADMPVQGSKGTITLNTRLMADGVYFYSLVLNEQSGLIRKLIVKH